MALLDQRPLPDRKWPTPGRAANFYLDLLEEFLDDMDTRFDAFQMIVDHWGDLQRARRGAFASSESDRR